MRRGVTKLSELLSIVQAALAVTGSQEQLSELAKTYYDIDTRKFAGLDPFSPAFRNRVLATYQEISQNRSYDPLTMERTDALEALDTATCPIPYRFADSRLVGEFLSCYGWILRTLDVKSGADILEYGSGEGQLSIHLARMGCNVCAIDIERRFLDSIQRQCDALGVGLVTQLGRFGDGVGDRRFDRIVFFEAFHHCLDHKDALAAMRGLLKPEGFICFSGEPIISAASPDREILPYPWGLRLDAEAIRSIAEFGWMELGYSEHYFVDLLCRSGYAVESAHCPGTWRASAYIARPYGTRYPIERDTMISTYDGRSGWHATEGAHRWTDGDAWFPVPEMGYQSVTVTLANMSGKPINVNLSCKERSMDVALNSGADIQAQLRLPETGGYLRIMSSTFRPAAGTAGAGDGRTLGVAVQAIEFS